MAGRDTASRKDRSKGRTRTLNGCSRAGCMKTNAQIGFLVCIPAACFNRLIKRYKINFCKLPFIYFAGLRFVQLQKNQSLHAGIKCTPFKAVYGSDPCIKLKTNIIPTDLKPLSLVASSTTRDLSNDAVEEINEFDQHDDEDDSVDQYEDAESENDLENINNMNVDIAVINPSSSKSLNQLQAKVSLVKPKDQLLRKRKVVETDSESSSDEDEVIQRMYLTRRKKATMKTTRDDEAICDGGSMMSDEQVDHFDSQDETGGNLNKGEADVNLASTEDGTQEVIFCCVCRFECTGYHMCIICDQFAHAICGVTQEEEGCGATIICRKCELRNQIEENTSQQAKKMLKRSNRKFSEVSTDDNVVVPIPEVDRAKCEFPNLVGIIMGKEDDLYVIGCRAGWIKEKLARNGFEKCSSNFLTRADVPGAWVTLRKASTLASVDGKAQGMFKCNCKKSCSVGKCKCKRANLLCNSKCHSSSSCDNKK